MGRARRADGTAEFVFDRIEAASQFGFGTVVHHWCPRGDDNTGNDDDELYHNHHDNGSK